MGLLATLSEGNMIAREVRYHEHCTTLPNKFCKFFNNQENHLKDVQKSLEAVTVAECMSFIEDFLQSSDEVAPFIKLSVILTFCCYCLENLEALAVSVSVTRQKENLLNLIQT